MMEKIDSPSPKIIRKKVNNCGHCKQINFIYFTWFVHNFVDHKQNVLLKRNDVSLMPLNTFLCVCMCACVSVCVFHVHSPWRLHLSGTVGMSGNRSTMLCWRRFFPLPSPFIATLAPSLATLSCSHTRSRQSHELTRMGLACQRLDSILSTFVTLSRFDGGKEIRIVRNKMA